MEDDKGVISFSGEIYNYVEIKKIEAKGAYLRQSQIQKFYLNV